MKKILLIAILLLTFPTLSSAANWKIIPEQSKIEFSATQNNNFISGNFKKFSGKIDFDPTQLEKSKVEIEVDISSVETSLSDATSTLKTTEWFSTKIFPKAVFSTTKITKNNSTSFVKNGFIADGILIIKGISKPVHFNFSMEEYNSSHAKAVGVINLKRSDFGIGAKNPDNAHGVKDEVILNFTIHASTVK